MMMDSKGPWQTKESGAVPECLKFVHIVFCRSFYIGNLIVIFIGILMICYQPSFYLSNQVIVSSRSGKLLYIYLTAYLDIGWDGDKSRLLTLGVTRPW